MRFVMLLLGLALVAMAGLWFLTPMLDHTYARHAPELSQPRSRGASGATASAPQGGVSRSQPSIRAPSGTSASSASVIASKNIVDNVMSMINAGTGLLGLWFGWMSYRLQKRDSRRD
jgi:hypothetical protein